MFRISYTQSVTARTLQIWYTEHVSFFFSIIVWHTITDISSGTRSNKQFQKGLIRKKNGRRAPYFARPSPLHSHSHPSSSPPNPLTYRWQTDRRDVGILCHCSRTDSVWEHFYFYRHRRYRRLVRPEREIMTKCCWMKITWFDDISIKLTTITSEI